ncbi:putative programmed cell death protein [Klebsormidium nitens]|uniref:Putative programmed cell death protein n=1 Tax=Klebsormidium nitens TaxID=105231 RepID=A0A1Y1HV96_KLENI|nr:putative programmed cell death protein [Klebsormidium nitens]|eukprot:GAQ82545.1 putative programmed cell death protein [Klebsormidium nitens]
MVKLEEVFSEDEEEVESEGEEEEEVLLGFVDEAANPESLERHFFPSKVGGVPAWLDPVKLPQGGATVCGFCGKPLAFLMQVYGPLESEPSAFHRTLFLFVCKSNTCLKRHFRQQEAPDRKHSVRVFRCQLPRSNPFYSFQPAKPGTLPPAGPAAPLCDWCGAWEANKRCGGCRDHSYCSKDHQVEHWRAGHSVACKRLDKRAPSVSDRADAQAGPSEASNAAEETRSRNAEPLGKRDTVARCSTEAVQGPAASGSQEAASLGTSSEVDPRAGIESAGISTREEMGQGGDAERIKEHGTRGKEESGASTESEKVQEARSESRDGGAASSTGADNVTRETADVTERVAALGVDDAGFPASPVDWEAGTDRQSGAASDGNAGAPEQGLKETGIRSEDLGPSSGGQLRQADVGSASGRQRDVDGSTESQHSGADVSGAGPSGQTQKKFESASEGGAGKNQNTEETGGDRTAELTAVVKPWALDPKLWPELEIAVESEGDYQGESEAGVSGRVNSGLSDVSALLEQYGRRVEKKREFSEEDLEEAEAGMRDMGGDKKQWAAFEARLAAAPEQVLRYCRSPDAKPLWPSSDHRPSEKGIPPCPECGSERIFEFQVLPQLLYYMHVDSSDPETLDWGTIAVYTCGKSCKGKEAYQEEVVWLQVPQ